MSVKITFIGAGSVVFSKQLLMDILTTPELESSSFSLFDIHPERLDTAKLICQDLVQSLGNKATVTATLDRREALQDADFVINMIQVGMHEATLLDFQIPAKYGLKQTIADTTGVGGLFRGLRTLPVMLSLAEDMVEVCPRAWLLNYTNPMPINSLGFLLGTKQRGLDVNYVGLCHSVQGTGKQLAGYLDVPYEELEYFVAGINHMSWFLKLKHNGEDLYPRLFEAMDNPEIYKTNKVRFEIMRHFGYFVTESSEHMSEYTSFFIKDPKLIEELDIPINEYITRSENHLKEYDKIREKIIGGGHLEVEHSHEYASGIIKAITTGTPWTFNGNFLNEGLIDNLPRECAVEVPCLVDRSGIHPCHAGTLPPQLAAMNMTNINVHRLAVEAFLTGKKEYLYHAVALDPLASSMLNLNQMRAMVDELVEAHGDALPKLS